MSQGTLIAHCGARKLTREELVALPVPEATNTFKPIPHVEVVNALVETLNFRHIAVVREEFAVSENGMRMFGVLDLEAGFDGARFSLGLRNSNDKSLRLAMTCGYRVFVCDNLAFQGEFTPVLAKHSKNFQMIDSLTIGVDRMQRNFKPMVAQVEAWQRSQISETAAKGIIYDAFIKGELDVPRHLARSVHQHYFEPPHEEFSPRTFWSLSNAFTEALKALDDATFFKATAKLGTFLAPRAPQALLPAAVEETVIDVQPVREHVEVAS
ncbi:MAG: DUF932 domain-containing protein [Verrucomicrobia bacterium]|nr:DUF932 domain-containing protein [Verrucomicrobiota bacterium]